MHRIATAFPRAGTRIAARTLREWYIVSRVTHDPAGAVGSGSAVWFDRLTMNEAGGPADAGMTSPNPQSAIRNPQSAIRNPQSAIRNPQSAIRNPQSAIRNPQSAIRNPQSAIRNPQSAIRNPQSAIRNPQSAIRNPQSAIFDLGWTP